MSISMKFIILCLALMQTACFSNQEESISKGSLNTYDTVENKISINKKTIENIQSTKNIATNLKHTWKKDDDKIVNSNGLSNFIINDTVSTIERNIHRSLDISSISDTCSVAEYGNLIQLLFMQNKLISIEVLNSNYVTDKGFKVNDSVATLKRIYPDIEYGSFQSLSEDAIQTDYFKTLPNSDGNYYEFRVSDVNSHIIDSFSVNNIQYDYKNLCDI
ncbi:hypothetical protein [uncultured Psychrobacter sp.]|uniref:hypothetical protein n=1 Tax=uncultured Psychrobacter sp. TaxID=259303 RepID=UPI00345B0EF2